MPVAASPEEAAEEPRASYVTGSHGTRETAPAVTADAGSHGSAEPVSRDTPTRRSRTLLATAADRSGSQYTRGSGRRAAPAGDEERTEVPSSRGGRRRAATPEPDAVAPVSESSEPPAPAPPLRRSRERTASAEPSPAPSAPVADPITAPSADLSTAPSAHPRTAPAPAGSREQAPTDVAPVAPVAPVAAPASAATRGARRRARLAAAEAQPASPRPAAVTPSSDTAAIPDPDTTAIAAVTSAVEPADSAPDPLPTEHSRESREHALALGALLTPRPAYAPAAEADTAPSEQPEDQAAPRPAPRTAKRIVAGVFSVACVGGLAITTTLPAFSAGESPVHAATDRIEQRLASTGAVDVGDALDAIGSVEVGVDPSSYRQIAAEAGLVDPSTLKNTDLRMPFDREWPLTDGFAYRTEPVEQFHDAQDIAAADGTPVQAIGAGVVVEAGYATDGCGFSVKLQHLVNDETLTSRYCHMQVASHDLKIGDTIAIGEQIGRVGNTGMSFGSHLHLALRRSGTPIDPLPYIEKQIERQAARQSELPKKPTE